MSAMLEFAVNHQYIRRIDSTNVVADSQNYLYAHFTFETDEWTGIKTAIFQGDGKPYEMLIDENGVCLVPHEAIENGNFHMTVSVFCGTLVTANTARVFVERSGYSSELESSTDPTPSIYEQILSELEYVKNNMDGGTFEDWQTEQEGSD